MDSQYVNVSARTLSGAQNSGSISVTDFSMSEIFLKTLLRATFITIIVLVTVFIPIIHLLSIPIGILVLIITVSRTMRTKSAISECSYPCPACGKTATIYSRRLNFPFTAMCDNCHREITFTTN